MEYIVTGAAGFIGSNLVRALNDRGITRILAVDNLKNPAKFANLVDCEIADYLDKDEFLAHWEAGAFDGVRAVLHQGACSDTMEQDGRYMMANNYRYSVRLLERAQQHNIPFLYASSASVYGDGRVFAEDRAHERPLNVYGYSKFLFDQYVRTRWPQRTAQIAGFRYFNVYGPREQHKGRMASVAWHFFHQYQKDGRVRLFEGSDGYGPGSQQRDFVFVDDVVRVNLYFLDNPGQSGIYNLGTGRAQAFNDVAVAVVNTCRARAGLPPQDLATLQDSGVIEYIPFPEALVGKYQSFTQADISRLRESGYTAPLATVEEGTALYVTQLLAAQER